MEKRYFVLYLTVKQGVVVWFGHSHELLFSILVNDLRLVVIIIIIIQYSRN